MKKIKLKFSEYEKRVIEFEYKKNNKEDSEKVIQKIEINPYATPSDKRVIANYAIQTSEDKTKTDENSLDVADAYSKFEYGFIGGVLATMTNIDIEKLNIDDVVASGLWEDIKNSIVNYWELVSDIEKVYDSRIREVNAESKLNKILDKLASILDNFSEIDFSPENIKKMIEQISIGKEKLAGVYPNISSNIDADKSLSQSVRSSE